MNTSKGSFLQANVQKVEVNNNSIDRFNAIKSGGTVSRKGLVYFSLFWMPKTAALGAGTQEIFDPLSVASSAEECSVCVSGSMESGVVPPFRAGERDTTAFRVAASWSPHPSVRIRAQGERLRMQWPSGENASGWGDLRLGTTGVFWGGNEGQPGIGMDWSIKLPNATDEGELGSDESDAAVGLFGEFESGSWRFGIRGSLLILGDPLQFANQDDAFLAGASLVFQQKQWMAMTRLDWREESPRNPRDVRWLVGARLNGLPGGIWLASEGGAGFTMAAPAWQAGILLGVSRPCRDSNRD